MSNRVGSPTIYSSILPNNLALSRVRSVRLSKQAQHRLHIIEHFLHKTRNVSLTCRHYAIGRSYFYKWYRRYDPRNLRTLESKCTKPHKLRLATYNYDFVSVVRKLRQDYPSYSAKKLARIVLRDFSLSYSAATIGRIIKRFGLYFRANLLRSKRRSSKAKQAWKTRKPYLLKADKPRSVIEFDMKHIYLGGVKQYAFVAVDIFTKEVVIYLANRPSSWQAKQALEKVLAVFGREMSLLLTIMAARTSNMLTNT